MKYFKQLLLTYTLIVISHQVVVSQNTPFSQIPVYESRIYSYAVDSAAGIIYWGGNANHECLGAMDAITGEALPWGSFDFGSQDAVKHVLLIDSLIYVYWEKSLRKPTIVAINKKGVIVPWSKDISTVNLSDPVSICSDGEYLYAFNNITHIPNVFNLKTGQDMSKSALIEMDYINRIVNVECNKDAVFIFTDEGINVYKWQYDSFKNPIAFKSIYYFDLTTYGYNYYDTLDYNTRGGADFVFANDAIYIFDDFILNGKQTGVLKLNWNSAANQLNLLDYEQPTSPLCGKLYIPTDVPYYIKKPKINCASFYDSTLYISGYALSDMSSTTCGEPVSMLAANPYISNTTSGFKPSKLFGPVAEHYDMRQIKTINNILFCISSRTYSSEGNQYTTDSISAYCLDPMRPSKFSKFKETVCKEDSAVNYSVANVRGSTYTWTYSGTGAKIHSNNSNAITIDFSLTATSGKIAVVETSICGLVSPPRELYVTIETPPTASAGQDKYLTCKNKTIPLLGPSSTAFVSYSWTGPENINTALQQTIVDKPGQYFLTATYNFGAGCHWRDTVVVAYDTIPPKPVLPRNQYAITCATPFVQVNGSSDGIVDSLRWVNSSGASLANPIKTGVPGKFTLVVVSGRNGCINSDSINVTTDKTLPPITTSFDSKDLTCTNDTLLLTGSSTGSTIYFRWIGNGDTLNNPASVTKSGIYLLQAVDTSNGCSSTKIVTINNKQNPPFLNAPLTKTLTCSSPSITLNATDVQVGTTLSWSGPNGYTSANPATISSTGAYTITAIDTLSGCSTDKTVNIDSKPILEIVKTSDTTICSGSSITLNASPKGIYTNHFSRWESKGVTISNNQSIDISPTDTTLYVVTLGNNLGCTGTDSIWVFVPRAITATVNSFMPCDGSNNGELQVSTTNGTVPYSYSLDGINFQSSSVFTKLSPGLYKIYIQDALSCSHITSGEISAKSSIPSIDFLVSTNISLKDSFVIVDISNPRPDSIIWNFPIGAQQINADDFSPIIICDKKGSFTISMKAYFGSCEFTQSKIIYLTPFDSTAINSNANKGIENILIYPNPNNGAFNLEVQLNSKQTFVIQVFDGRSIEKYKQAVSATDNYANYLTIPQVENGTYLLKVTSEYDMKSKTVIVNK